MDSRRELDSLGRPKQPTFSLNVPEGLTRKRIEPRLVKGRRSLGLVRFLCPHCGDKHSYRDVSSGTVVIPHCGKGEGVRIEL
jgi:hypothetical protein